MNKGYSAWIHRFAWALHLVGLARPLPARVGTFCSVSGGSHPDGALRVGMGPHRPTGLRGPIPTRPDDPDERLAITQNGGSRLSSFGTLSPGNGLT